ncbi:MAG: hypothetical protein ACREN2_01240 [Candidatus Dormibacteria bacterium]
MDEALLLFQARLSSHPEHGAPLGNGVVWALRTENTEPELIIYYQFNDDNVFLLSIRRRMTC